MTLPLSRADAVDANDDPERRPLIRMLKGINRLFARVYHDLEVISPCRLPRTGPAILVCNHISGLDPLLIQSSCPRMIVWMMAKEYYDLGMLNWGFRAIEAIPVARSGRDMAATRQALRALHRGRIVGIFPEGRIEPSRELLPFQTGVALLGAKSKVEIFPAYLDGTQRGKKMVDAVLHPQRARIAFGAGLGRDIDDRSREALDAASAQIQEAVKILQSKTQPFPSARVRAYD